MSDLSARRALLALAVLLFWLSSPAARAQAAPDTTSTPPALAADGTAAQAANTMQEVVVTAERRETDLQKTPLAITALPQAALDESNILDAAGLNGYVPSLNVTRSGGFETVVTIRGVGSQTPENQPATDPGVSLFIDGVYMADDIAMDQSFFDLDSVEVLRGPQGVLYGVSSTGGAVNLVTRQPELATFGGSGDVSLGNFNYHRERAELNIPIGDTLAVRMSAQKLDHDGYTTDTLASGYKLDDAHDTSSKIALKWQPAGNFSATLTGQWYIAQDDGAAQKSIADPNPDPRVLTQDFLPKFALDTQLYHLNLKWDSPWLSISSVSAYQGLQNDLAMNATFSSFALYPGFYNDVPEWTTQVKSYSEELDLLSPQGSKLDWIGGVFLERSTTNTFVIEYEGNTPNPDLSVPADVEENPPSNLAYGNSTDDVRTSVEPFLQATYPLSSALRATVGGRYNYEAHQHHNINFNEFGANSVNMASVVNSTYETHVPTWRAELQYDLTSDSMLYGSFSRGYKPGGVNGNPRAALVPLTFLPETNTAFELGSKNFVLDRTLRANVAAFYYLYRDMQYIEADPVPFDQGMANIPSIRIWGGEAEVAYLGLHNRLHLNANLTAESGAVQGDTHALDSTVVNPFYGAPVCASNGQFFNPVCWAAIIAGARNIEGNQPPDMPRLSGSASVSYDFRLPRGTLSPRFEYVYRGSLWARIFNEPTIDRIGAYELWNVNLSYVPDGSNFTLSLSATNLANTPGVNSRYTSPYESGVTSQEYIAPRLIIGSIAYHF
ncbi:MAG TPA: TonB-dependent receptor [Steroidobacteraceae bacterium]